MTRINTIHPSDLLNEWLIAEWRELPRITNEMEKHPNRFDVNTIPHDYRMGVGHVKFFRDKLLFLAKRHREIKREMRKRGIKYDRNIKVQLYYLTPYIKENGCNDWEPNQRDHEILIERLCERFDLRKKPYSITQADNIKVKINCDHTFNDYLNEYIDKYM